MKKISYQTLLITIFLSTFSVPALADNECGNYKTSYEQTFCLAKLILKSDNELNQVYSELMKKIKPDLQEKLKSVETDWIEYRNTSCSESCSIEMTCSSRVNRERIKYLQARLRECKAGSCNNDAIAAASWN
jgi:uncharacterized protein YecT (DUF1311 family)